MNTRWRHSKNWSVHASSFAFAFGIGFGQRYYTSTHVLFTIISAKYMYRKSEENDGKQKFYIHNHTHRQTKTVRIQTDWFQTEKHTKTHAHKHTHTIQTSAENGIYNFNTLFINMKIKRKFMLGTDILLILAGMCVCVCFSRIFLSLVLVIFNGHMVAHKRLDHVSLRWCSECGRAQLLLRLQKCDCDNN